MVGSPSGGTGTRLSPGLLQGRGGPGAAGGVQRVGGHQVGVRRRGGGGRRRLLQKSCAEGGGQVELVRSVSYGTLLFSHAEAGSEMGVRRLEE